MRLRWLLIVTALLTPAFSEAQAVLKNPGDAAATSVLASGRWFKMKINRSGIYKLTYEDILEMGFTNPANVRVYGNGGAMLPLVNGIPRNDDLIENTLYIYKGADGAFGQGDYLLFYGLGPVTWSYNPASGMFEHQLHLYSNGAYYFITDAAGIGRQITERPALTGNPTVQVNAFDDYNYHEKELYNLLESGRQWFGEKIEYSAIDTTFTFANLETGSPVKAKVNVVCRSANPKTFQVNANNSAIGNIYFPTGVNLDAKTSVFAQQKSGLFTYSAKDDQVTIQVGFNKTTSTDEGYVDYIIVNARRKLELTGNMLFFRDLTHTGNTVIASYSVSGATSQTEIWDITDPFNIQRIPAQLQGSVLTFTDSTHSTPKEYVAVNPQASFPAPDIAPHNEIGIVANQNLHGQPASDMLIVSHPLFRDIADSIAAFHRLQDSLSVVVATTEQVYNEFSSGAPDVSAIRDFARLLYNKSTGDENRLKYLMLVGDGSHNNLSKATGNANYILTYQSLNSLDASASYVSDDFFGYMEDGEGGAENMGSFTLELGVGRLPVKSYDEALAMYRKIRNYSTASNRDDWRNNILFVADDEDGNIYMNQSNVLANWMESAHPQFAVKKVLIDAYKQEAGSTGTRYPDANRAILENIRKGLLVFNYIGHGGEIGLADEQILMNYELESLTNSDRLPLFVTATCEFSRFDDLTRDNDGNIVESTSAGESSLVNPNGGSIALFTTTRIVYSTDNYNLNTRFLQILFARLADGTYPRLGDAVKQSKNLMGTNRNKLNFILLGDPALKLAIPGHTIVTDSINQVSVYEPFDTLKAFSRIRISGHVENYNNEMLEDFNGILYPSVYDKEKIITTLANDDNATPMQFDVREDLLYKGKASISDGRFSFEFKVPKDITYSYGNGKIIYYAGNSNTDANGYFNAIVVGGTSSTLTNDNQGPEINLFLNDNEFTHSGIASPNPLIYAEIADESGINTVGNGIGHDITGILDNNTTNPIVLNDYFESNLNDFTSGILRYPMANLSEGWHDLEVKVWDVYNNSSVATLRFRVVGDNSIIIANMGNYPNPAGEFTRFTFEHNKAGEALTVDIFIFDMAGKLVASFSENIIAEGFNTTLPEWPLNDQYGNKLRQGIYPYRVTITDAEGRRTHSHQKLVVIRQ